MITITMLLILAMLTLMVMGSPLMYVAMALLVIDAAYLGFHRGIR